MSAQIPNFPGARWRSTPATPEVSCHHLSRGGFSFFLPRRPDFDALAVAFDDPPEAIYMAAEVSYCEDVLVYSFGEVRPIRGPSGRDDDQDLDHTAAKPMVLVGYRFLGRLHKQHLQQTAPIAGRRGWPQGSDWPRGSCLVQCRRDPFSRRQSLVE